MKSFGGNFSCDFLTKRYQERVRGRDSTIQTRTICEIVVSHNKIIHQVTVLFVIILSIIFGFVNRQNDKCYSVLEKVSAKLGIWKELVENKNIDSSYGATLFHLHKIEMRVV